MENGELRIIKKIILFTFHFSLFILLLGCAVKTTPVYAVIKTPKIKVADQGFIKEGFGYKKLIIYKAANVPVSITVKNSFICFNGKCIDKSKFIKEFLPEGYPDDFFDKILNKECPGGYFCKKSGERILFRDRKNKILIMIKELGNGS
jgi:hypothetical protein